MLKLCVHFWKGNIILGPSLLVFGIIKLTFIRDRSIDWGLSEPLVLLAIYIVESVIGNRLDRLEFTFWGAALSRTPRMRDASCTWLPFLSAIFGSSVFK